MQSGIRAGVIVALTAALAMGCDDGVTDGGTPPTDSGIIIDDEDAGGTPPDSGVIADAGAGVVDAGRADAGVVDAGLADAGDVDAGSDGGTIDAGTPDAGGQDAGAPDAGPDQAPGAGDLVIVEVQGNPTNISDDEAEYFEVLNVSDRTLDMQGVWFAFHTWVGGETENSVSTQQVSSPLLVAPGDRVLFGRSQEDVFGPVPPAITYAGFEFNNSQANRIRLMVPTWGGNEPPSTADLIDGVVFAPETFDNDLRGQAFQFDPSSGEATAEENDDNGNWCHTSQSLSPYLVTGTRDNHGTPGTPNDCG